MATRCFEDAYFREPIRYIHLRDIATMSKRQSMKVVGPIRSLGGWFAVKAMRRSGNRERCDERILGSGEFVERIIKEAEDKIKYQLPVKEHHHKIDEFIAQICSSENVSIEELKAGSRRKEVSGVRAQIAIGLVERHGVALAEVARRVGVSTSAISKILKRVNQ